MLRKRELLKKLVQIGKGERVRAAYVSRIDSNWAKICCSHDLDADKRWQVFSLRVAVSGCDSR
jgi:hypothetical protein